MWHQPPGNAELVEKLAEIRVRSSWGCDTHDRRCSARLQPHTQSKTPGSISQSAESGTQTLLIETPITSRLSCRLQLWQPRCGTSRSSGNPMPLNSAPLFAKIFRGAPSSLSRLWRRSRSLTSTPSTPFSQDETRKTRCRQSCGCHGSSSCDSHFRKARSEGIFARKTRAFKGMSQSCKAEQLR